MGNKSGRVEQPGLKKEALGNKNLSIGQQLKSCTLLSAYSDDELASIGAVVIIKKYRTGDFLVKQGDEGDGFYIIGDGNCVVEVEKDGSTITVGRLKQGDYFGEMALQNNQPRGASVKADGAVSAFFMHREEFKKIFGNYKFTKRVAVSAESESKGKADGDYAMPAGAVTTKDAATTTLISEAVKENHLFQGLGPDSRTKVIAAMYSCSMKKGDVCIKQGDKGDLFYVVQTGMFDIEVNGKKVATRGPRTAFGELALMYNAPRAATVRAATDSMTWVIHRSAYRRIIKTESSSKMQEYTGFLKTVSLLAPLSASDRQKLADAIDEVRLPAGMTVFNQGDEGDVMYLVAQGELNVEKDGQLVATCKKGDYFGERALFMNDKRAATVKVSGSEDAVCLQINRDTFQLVLGPLEALLEKRSASYEVPETPKSTRPIVSSRAEHVPVAQSDLKELGTLGKGSFGHVTLVQDCNNDKTYALKAVSKAMVKDTGQTLHILSEKNVMMSLNHPFIIKLYQTYKDQNHLYFLLEPVLGGELFTYLREQNKFDEPQARFYAACVVSAFESMHEQEIIYRDLKPENLLIDASGYIKITDFGFAKKIVDGNTYTLCGTPDYLAPEIVAGQGHGKGVDWWTVGILIFEMLASYPPFYDEDPMKTYAKIMNGEIQYPPFISKSAESIIKKLLDRKSARRLGVGKGGSRLIRKHPWFESLDFDSLNRKTIEAPYCPVISSVTDLQHFKDVADEKPDVFAQYTDQDDWAKDF